MTDTLLTVAVEPDSYPQRFGESALEFVARLFDEYEDVSFETIEYTHPKLHTTLAAALADPTFDVANDNFALRMFVIDKCPSLVKVMLDRQDIGNHQFIRDILDEAMTIADTSNIVEMIVSNPRVQIGENNILAEDDFIASELLTNAIDDRHTGAVNAIMNRWPDDHWSLYICDSMIELIKKNNADFIDAYLEVGLAHCVNWPDVHKRITPMTDVFLQSRTVCAQYMKSSSDCSEIKLLVQIPDAARLLASTRAISDDEKKNDAVHYCEKVLHELTGKYGDANIDYLPKSVVLYNILPYIAASPIYP